MSVTAFNRSREKIKKEAILKAKKEAVAKKEAADTKGKK